MDMQINTDTTLPMIMTGVRYAVTALGGILVTKGFLPADSDVNQLAGAACIIVSTIWGIYLTRKNKKQVVEAAVTPTANIDFK